ncbi:hypothetical protein BDV30DRAFT_204141 [Aspergillus minisclerotigenes]|uniref:RNB domain-containing protein n=1 Tax=Aspergillus minisclerotigenes TaxID=656917 RepID=A0A5N6JGW6_9EURO|nr:hypothetical protein BDV30DRAFT_204141 [Aspergillus minisclerotigenes]
MSLTLLRCRVSQSVADVNVINRNRSATSICGVVSHFRSLPQRNRFSLRRRDGSSRYYSEVKSPPQDLLRSSTSIEDIRLKSEFEENKDIREYLRKWQESHPNPLDPVRGPGTSNTLDASAPWVGNMLNDYREAHDAGSDALRETDEDVSDFENIAEEGEGMHDFLEPGDLVALSSAEGILNLAVYVRSVCKQQQFYTDRGKWRIAFAKDLDFVIKGFAPRELVAPLLPHFPDALAQLSLEMQSAIEGGVPRPTGAPILRMINDFNEQVHQFYQANAYRLDNIHEIVADEEEKLEFTLKELACKALDITSDQVDDKILFAVHRAIRRNSFLIENDRSSIFTDHYFVQPRRVANILDTVVTWVHEHQEYLIRAVTGNEVPNLKDHPIQQFIQKAQRLIRLSRKVRSPTILACVGPTAQRYQPGQDGKPLVYREVLTEKFSYTDQMIIEFLQLWCIPPRRMTSGILRSAGSHIMRATGMYSALDTNAGTAALFLQEVGVVAPWENLRLLDQNLALPGHGISRQSDRKWEDVQRACEELNSEGVTDKMESMRTDFGDLPVYCVDDPGAQEIDDGVSLERIPGSDDTFWIRVHVANPSAFINPDALIMEHAAFRVQTVYAPERTYPMLPNTLTQEHFSLAPGRPTLTFSAKMNLQGEILDTNIVNGIARNVIYITHDKLRSLFEPEPQGVQEPLTVGGEYSNEHTRDNIQEELSSEDEGTFHTLRKLMLAFREHRRRNGAMEWPSSMETPVSVTVGNAPLKPYNMQLTEGRYILGDPIIQLRPRTVDPHEVPDLTKRNLISTLMNLACYVSGKWLAERGIPAVFDGTFYHPEYPKLTNSNMSDYGGKTWLQLAAPKGISSSRPTHHVPLGLDTYVKSTSPLRRYTDLMAHYQIEAALRFEHEHGRRFDATTDESILPFSHMDVDNFISQSRWKRSRIRDIDSASKQFWACMLLFRAFYFGECRLPETFTCLVHKPYNSTALVGSQFAQGYSGVVTSLGVRCQIVTPPEMSDVDILSVVEAKITSVDLSRMLVIMEATRMVKKFERVGEWR